jgi:hypothetical protein
MTKSLDLARLLPNRYRDKTIDSLIGNLFNQHVSKPDTETFHGFIGSKEGSTASDIYLEEKDLERQINQLAPALYIKAATEEDIVTWSDLLQRMALLGISYDALAEWFTIGTQNFVPPIDIDKFVNYSEYLWIGNWLHENSALPYSLLGIDAAASLDAMSGPNPQLRADYYVVKRDLVISTDWSKGNLWVHKDDALAFFNSYGSSLTFSLGMAAKRPIIELDADVAHNATVDSTGTPCSPDNPTAVVHQQAKIKINQPVQLDLYYHNGEHTGLTSAGFYYKESPEAPIDVVLGRRIVIRGESYIFAHGFTHPVNGRTLWYSRNQGIVLGRFSISPTANKLSTLWTVGFGESPASKTVEYKKLSTIGTVLNLDKLLNFQDYFWVEDSVPQYNVIAGNGTSDWSHNAWVHVSSLSHDQRLASTPAARPIIEFNSQLEAELLSQIKTSAHELPRFKLYVPDSVLGLVSPPTVVDPSLNDVYTNGVLFARLVDIHPALQKAFLTSPELSSRLVTVNGEAYVQSFAFGAYRGTRDTATYGYISRELTRDSIGTGQAIVSIDPTSAIPRVLKLTATSPTAFTLRSPADDFYATLTVGIPFVLDGVALTVMTGSTPFSVGDTIYIEVKSVIFERASLYCKLGSEFKTFLAPEAILTDNSERKLVNANIGIRDGAWVTHPAFEQNLDSSNGDTFDQSDLITHFASIIAAQPDFQGNEYGRNNWRDLTDKEFNLGGSIKQLDQRLALFLSTLLQPGLTATTLLETSKQAYESMLSRVREYVEEQLIDDMALGVATLAGPSASVDQATIDQLITFLEGMGAPGDLGVGRPYFDTTMPIRALTLTGPYLGLSIPAAPGIVYDPELNITAIRHHDGHQTKYPTVDDAVLKRLVLKLFKRSTGQVTAGFVSGPTPPTKPFAKQLWLDLSTMTLFVYDVVSDTGALPTGAAYGAYSYIRDTGEVFIYNGDAWTSLGNTQGEQDALWRAVDLSKTLAELTLAIEQILFKHCPNNVRLDIGTVEALPRMATLLQQEFETFAAQHGILDPYNPGYDASNPFTWNYAGGAKFAAWQDIYLDQYAYGTARPDLEPWVSTNYINESSWLTAMIAAGLLPAGTSAFIPSTMWSLVASKVKADLITVNYPYNNPGALSVDPATGALLPPFAFGHPEQMLSDPPPTPTARFVFGDVGPAERAWLRTTEYQLALNRSYYRLDPLTFTSAIWGDTGIKINGYRILLSTGNKAKIADVQIHGAPDARLHDHFATGFALAALPSENFIFGVLVRDLTTVEIQLPGLDPILSLVHPTQKTVVNVPVVGLTFMVTPPLTGLIVGSKVKVIIDNLGGDVSEDYSFPGYIVSSGLGQVLVHSLRREAIDLTLTQALTRLTAWEPRLAYRFNALVDTSSLVAKLNDETITKSNLRVLLDEVRHKTSSWFSALKVTLHRKGGAERQGNIMVPSKSLTTGQRGDDWVFRVDLMNKQGPGIEWYSLSGEPTTFIALSGKNTLDEWKRPEVRGNVTRAKGPFLVTGLQNLIVFLYGYADRQEALGFRAGGTVEPVFDDKTGRKIDWQFLIEMIVDKQFTGVNDGSITVLNPFSREFAFVAPVGVVTSFADPITDEALTPLLLNESGKRLQTGRYRVFRQGELTTANFDDPVYGIHVMTSVYEHVMVLPYADGSKPIFTPLLGQAAAKFFVTGERQKSKHGRLDFGGKFLRGHDMSENIEASVGALRNLFDSESLTADTARAQRVRAMLGFNSSTYFDDRGTSPASEFRFYQGLLHSKGTNAALEAYINSRQYKSAYIDEFWAYKVASYGDGRPVIDVDMKVSMEDFTGDYANFLFLEDDELGHLNDWTMQQGYDVPNFDVAPLDGYSIYSDQLQFVENIDPRGCILVRSDDPSRWYRYGDVGQLRYFEADKHVDIKVHVSAIGAPIRLRTAVGELVRADAFEVLEYAGPNLLNTYREPGDYILGTTPPDYSTPVFRRLNHSTIVFDDVIMAGKNVTIRCFAPALEKFTPVKLFRYNPEVISASDDIIWWDHARGYHHPEAFAHVDHQLKHDPALYNESYLRGDGVSVNPSRPWGEDQVGKVWWDMSRTAWLPYSDTKIYTDVKQRLSAWGGVAEDSDLKLYEWVEASVPPAEYRNLVEKGTASGEIGLAKYIYRDRVWEQCPVAWLYSLNPQQHPRAALAYQTTRLVEAIYNGIPHIIGWEGSLPAVLNSNIKLAGANYVTSSRTPSELIAPIGQLLIVDDTYAFIVGSTTDVTAPAFAATPSFTNVKLELLQGTLLSIKAARGTLVIDSEIYNNINYARATFTNAGLTQRIEIPDTPVKAGTPYELLFDNIGVKLTCLTVNNHTAVTLTAPALRKATVAAELCNPAHSLSVREGLQIQVQIPTGLDFLPGPTDGGINGWIAWKDPIGLTSDNLAPINMNQPLLGAWTPVDTRLGALTSDIRERLQDPWVLKSGETIAGYRAVWSRWKLLKDLSHEAMYLTGAQSHIQMSRNLGFADLAPNVINTARVYVNGRKVTGAPIVEGNLGFMLLPSNNSLKQGDSIRVIIPGYVPTADQLAADLSLPFADPSALREFKLDTPHVKVEERNEQGRISRTRYFYWVTGKEDQGLNKRMSTLLAERLLRDHDSGYAVPQVFKSFNQVDGRPNRYALLCVRGISHLVSADNTFRLRLTRDPGLRDSAEENHLKSRHHEWALIRPNQPTRIPKELWDKMVDTLCAETAAGAPLPYVQLYEHDLQSDVKASYGLGIGQVLTDRDQAKATVIGTISNTRVVKYDKTTNTFVPDQIDYIGFDFATITAQMETASGTRKLMGELWLNAKSKQLNELFFAVLEDALAKTTELADIFKTSFVALGEVRTVAEASLAGSKTISGLVYVAPPVPLPPMPTPAPTPAPAGPGVFGIVGQQNPTRL